MRKSATRRMMADVFKVKDVRDPAQIARRRAVRRVWCFPLVGRRLARSWAWQEISQPTRVERLGRFGSCLAQKRVELGPGLALGDDRLPPLIAFALEQKAREIGHFILFGFGKSLAEAH